MKRHGVGEITDSSPYAERRYRTRFYFDPNSISMVSNDAHYLLVAYLMDTTIGVLRLELRYSGGYQVRVQAVNDASSWSGTSWYTISDAPHYFEVDWQAASAPLANNGVLKLWIDGVLKQAITNLDNDTRQIDWVRLGAVSGIDTGTRGTYYFDAYGSTRSSYIGQHYDSVTATFVYDGDGRRVKGTVNGVTTVILGDHYEVRTDGEGEATREYYFAGGGPVAVGELPSGKLSWLITDHLGSLSAVADGAGALTAELRYRAFGDLRYLAGIPPTAYQYTGQRAEPLLGLYDYRARWYDPGVGRFAQPDTFVPGGGPMAWDRYAYGLDNPLKYLDPMGHKTCDTVSETGDCYAQTAREVHLGYGINVKTKDIDESALWTIADAAVLSSLALRAVGGGSGVDLFRATHGPIEIAIDPTARFEEGGVVSNCQTIGGAITCTNSPPLYNVLHEFGHVFDNQYASTSKDRQAADYLDPLAFNGVPIRYAGESIRTDLGYVCPGMPCQASQVDTLTEEFGDMYMNYVFEVTGANLATNGFTNDPYGIARFNNFTLWMTTKWLPGMGVLR